MESNSHFKSKLNLNPKSNSAETTLQGKTDLHSTQSTSKKAIRKSVMKTIKNKLKEKDTKENPTTPTTTAKNDPTKTTKKDPSTAQGNSPTKAKTTSKRKTIGTRTKTISPPTKSRPTFKTKDTPK
jgi:hypothetical protein